MNKPRLYNEIFEDYMNKLIALINLILTQISQDIRSNDRPYSNKFLSESLQLVFYAVQVNFKHF